MRREFGVDFVLLRSIKGESGEAPANKLLPIRHWPPSQAGVMREKALTIPFATATASSSLPKSGGSIGAVGRCCSVPSFRESTRVSPCGTAWGRSLQAWRGVHPWFFPRFVAPVHDRGARSLQADCG